MAAPRAFTRELKLATAGLEPAAIASMLARLARQSLAEAQQAGEASSSYTISVNGRIGASEDSVVPPGPIVYSFSWLPEIATYALAYCEGRSPVLSGRFKKSWFTMVNGRRQDALENIPLTAEVIITNDQPYARKIEVGHMKMRVPPGIVEDARQAILRKFGDIARVEKKFISLAGAYVLKSAGRRRRRDTRAGRELTYPALVINMRY